MLTHGDGLLIQPELLPKLVGPGALQQQRNKTHNSQTRWRVQMMNQNNQCYDGQFRETPRFIKFSPQKSPDCLCWDVCLVPTSPPPLSCIFGTDLPPPLLWELIVLQIFNQCVMFFFCRWRSQAKLLGGGPTCKTYEQGTVILAELALEMSKVQLLDSFWIIQTSVLRV